MSMDGNEVLVKCGAADAPSKRTSRLPARNGEKIKPFSNEWFMLTDPQTGRILGMEYMHDPENTEVKIKSLTNILPFYPNCNLVIHDLICKLASAVTRENMFP